MAPTESTMSRDITTGADEQGQQWDETHAKIQLNHKRRPLPWNKPAVGIELKSRPIYKKKPSFVPSQYEPTFKVPKPQLVTPRLPKNRLPWLDGKPPSVRPADGPRKTSVPGGFVSESDTGAVSSSKSLSLSSLGTDSSPRGFRRANTTIRSVESSPSLRRKLTDAPLKRRLSSVTPAGLRPNKRKSVKIPGVDKAFQDHSGAEVGEPSQSSPLQSLQSAETSIIIFEESESSFPIKTRGTVDASGDITEFIEEYSAPENTGANQERIGPLIPASTRGNVQASPRRGMRKPQDQHFENATELFEDLVDEVVRVAEDAADQGNLEEVTDIIQNSSKVSQTASNIRARHLMAVGEPLKVSNSTLDYSSETLSSSESSDSSRSSFSGSSQGILRRAVRPAGASRTRHNKPMTSDRNDVAKSRQSPESLNLETSPGSPESPSTIDWAYVNKRGKQKKRPSSSRSTNSSLRRLSRLTEEFEDAPEHKSLPARTRDRVSFITDSASHRRRLHRAHPTSSDERRQRKHSSRTAYLHHENQSYDSPDNSFNSTEDDFGLPRPTTESSRISHISHTSSRPKSLKFRDQVHAHRYSVHRHSRRQPIARNWSSLKKRVTAIIACTNTFMLGIMVGIYAGEVPRIQYQLADETHAVILGNMTLYLGLAMSTFISWPLPLLHGRKPYILGSLAIALPLQFPQALIVSRPRSPNDVTFKTSLLVVRGITGVVLGFANVNFLTTLFDLFGASLQSKRPHQELVIINDIRRHGGGMGLWLGLWSWCFIGSLAIGFQIGAGIIESLNPEWGFYIIIILMAAVLVLNILVPETRRSQYRKSVTEVYNRDENYITRRVSQGEIKLHISTTGPKYWFEEVWAGIKLSMMMMCQWGFTILAIYLGWIYAQIVLVIVLLGALLSREYRWHACHVGLGVMSVAIGALLAVPLTKGGIFSRERKKGPRTDSMTLQREVVWSSHFVRRILFMLSLPLVSLAYTVSSAGKPRPYMVPIVFASTVAFFSILAIAECHGLIMETFDTCDLQPGVNTRHRLQSMAADDRRRRTNYSSFPRISAGIFLSQTIGFILAAVATAVGGQLTRSIGAQASTGVTAGILLFLTIALTIALFRFREVQVIPNHAFGTRRNTAVEFGTEVKGLGTDDWKAVIIGNPSGKMRRMSILELGSMSRWTEVRRLNKLLPNPPPKRKRVIT